MLCAWAFASSLRIKRARFDWLHLCLEMTNVRRIESEATTRKVEGSSTLHDEGISWKCVCVYVCMCVRRV